MAGFADLDARTHGRSTLRRTPRIEAPWNTHRCPVGCALGGEGCQGALLDVRARIQRLWSAREPKNYSSGERAIVIHKQPNRACIHKPGRCPHKPRGKCQDNAFCVDLGEVPLLNSRRPHGAAPPARAVAVACTRLDARARLRFQSAGWAQAVSRSGYRLSVARNGFARSHRTTPIPSQPESCNVQSPDAGCRDRRRWSDRL